MATATSTPPPSVSPRLAVVTLLVAAVAAVGPYWAASVGLLMSDLVAYFPSLYASLPGMWDPTVQTGSPLLPNPQAGWFYPPAWLLAGDLQRGLPLYVAGHLAVAGVATWAWVRTRLGDGLEALLAGLIFLGSGATLSLALTPDKLPGHAALPLLLVGLHWLLGDDRPGRRAAGWLLGCGAVAMIWLGGSVEAFFLAALAGPAWAAGMPGGAAGQGPRRAGIAVGVLAAGTLLAGCLLVPFFILLPETARSGALPMAEALHRATHPVDWLGWLTPNPFWAGEDLRYVLDDAGTSRARWLRTMYGGCLLAPLLGGLAVARARGPGALLAAAGLVGFAFLALGDLNPLRGLLHALPGVGSMRYPDKWWLGTVPFQAWLGALGLRAVLTDRRAAGVALGIAGLLIGAGLLGLIGSGGGPMLRAARALTATIGVLGVGAAVILAARRGHAAWGWLLVLVFGLDLLAAGAAAFPQADALAARQRPAAVAAIRADWLPRSAHPGDIPRIWDESQHQLDGRLPDAAPGEVHRAAQRAVLAPNTAVEHGLAYTDGMRAVRLRRQALYTAVLEDLDPPTRRRLLRAIGADYWVTYSGAEALALARAAALRPVPSAPGAPLDVGLLAEPDPLGRLRLVSGSRRFPDDAAAYRFMQARSADIVAIVQGDPGVLSLPRADTAAAPVGALVWAVASTDRWEAAWDSDHDAILVLQQAWAPGWQTSLDQGPWRPAARVEHMLIGAAAPAGAHSIVFRYRPDGLGAGVALSLVALWVALGVALRLRRGGLVP